MPQKLVNLDKVIDKVIDKTTGVGTATTVNNVTIVVIVRAAIGTTKIATDAVDVAAVEMDAMKVRRVAIALMVKMTSRLAMTQWKCLGISTSETRVTDSFASMGICHRATIRTCL